ncbi:hypothetical protein BX661DRAFT_175936 [Kickxella alabastrina]|uniref:uncharacterized protein n=1 Tax=Kickxella alabastrina TaxID=61397 RepID=UPI00221FC60D|nr:uncharacterized protein BX661DRAFT_175936 [Kickxella alabastrina]KAI7835009.1 hypothetical protein BX661DRAFT_175936 [Kickxella alabastrina]
MIRIQLSSLDEFIAGLSKLDYEAAKIASSKVMEVHIQMGALMFSLLTIEMMYTSMDYLSPGNFRRGNSYLLNMYTPLPRRLNKLLNKLVVEYEDEHRRLLSSRVQPAATTIATHAESSDHGNQRSVVDGSGIAFGPSPGHAGSGKTTGSFVPRSIIYGFESSRPKLGAESSSYAESKMIASGANAGAGLRLNQNQIQASNRNVHGTESGDSARIAAPTAGSYEAFDPNKFVINTEKAEAVMEELETIKKFVGFISKLVEVRKTMVVLYRFVAVTGPVLYTKKLRLILEHCRMMLRSIAPNPLYNSLLDNICHEVRLVGGLVDWDSHIVSHNFVKSVTSMKTARNQLKAWEAILPECSSSSSSSAVAGATVRSRRSTQESAGDLAGAPPNKDSEGSSRHSLLYAALTKSTKLVQSLLWGDSTSSSSNEEQIPTAGRMRGIVIWIGFWVEHLSFKTTAYFQQVIAPCRALQHDDSSQSGLQQAVLHDMWNRPGLSKTNLGDMITNFMHANDGCFVALLFESSAQRPYTVDGYAISGTKIKVPDYRVQACATLFCMSNRQLLRARNCIMGDSMLQDVHSIAQNAKYRGAADVQRQSDADWFRQNCLPDILYILEGDKATLDYELLGSSPLLDQLGADADKLLGEISDSVYDVVEAALEDLAKTEERARAALTEAQHIAASSMRGTASFSTRIHNYPEAPVEHGSATPDQQSKYNMSIYDSKQPGDMLSPLGRPGGRGHEYHNAPLLRSESLQQPIGSSKPAPPPHQGSALSQLHSEEEGPDLYSTYLLKSHLRNNISAHEKHVLEDFDGRRFTRRQSGYGASTMMGGEYVECTYSEQSMREGAAAAAAAASVAAASAVGPPVAFNRDMVAVKPTRAKTSADGARAAVDPTAIHRTAVRRPTTTYVASGNAAGRDMSLISRNDNGLWNTDVSQSLRRVSAGNLQGLESLRFSSANDLSIFTGRRVRGTIASTSNTSMETGRQSPSVRSLFRSTLKPSAQALQSPNSAQKTAESGVARRVRRGERLRELFGSWQTACNEEDMPEDATAAGLPASEIRRGSVTSLSYSTPTRMSTVRKPNAASMLAPVASTTSILALANTSTSSAQPSAPGTESGSGGLGHQALRAAALSRTATINSGLMAAATASTATHHSHLAPEMGSLDNPTAGSSLQKPQSQHLVPPPSNGQAAAAESGRSEGYTYLYSRVSVPNVVMVAVLLDTEKGLSRRREATHAWDEIVNVIRGTPLFEQLMKLTG